MSLKHIFKILLILLGVYTTTFVALELYAARIADPTVGGISRSEVLEGVVPGGLNSLLIVWIILISATVIIWIISKLRNWDLKF